MALTRKFLQALGVVDTAIDAIIDEHTATTTRLNDELKAAKGDAAKLAEVQKELDTLKAADYEGKYNAEKTAHEALKTSVQSEKTKTAKQAALKAYFEGKRIKDGNLDIAMTGVSLDSIELDGDKIKDTTNLDALVEGVFKPLISSADDKPKPKAKVVDSGAKSGVNENGGNDGKILSLRDALREEYAQT